MTEDLLERRLAALGPEATRWWTGLAPGDRVDLTLRWSPGRLRFVAWREAPPEPPTWNEDLYEYVVGHAEQVFFLGPRPHHICRAHPAAREAVRAGAIPATFACPLTRSDCPLRALVAGGAVHLGATAVR